MNLKSISVTILTKNSEKYLKEVLEALKSFDEVLIFDNGSKDSSLDIAQNYPNVTIHKGEFIGFGPTHNLASSLAKHDWVLSIDSDEVVSEVLVNEIALLDLNPDNTYAISRHNEFNGKWIQWCGWHPDFQTRLYHRKKASFSEHQVHEAVQSEKIVRLTHSLKHYSYANVADFLTKMQSYSDLFAKQNQGKKSSSPFKALTHGFFAFFKSYFLKKGFLGGYEGFLISSYNAHTAFYKYMKLYELNKSLDKQRG